MKRHLKTWKFWIPIKNVLKNKPIENQFGLKIHDAPILNLQWLEDRIAPAVHDTLISALPIPFPQGTVSQIIQSEILQENQEDIFKVSLFKGDRLAVKTIASVNDSTLDTYLRIFADNGMDATAPNDDSIQSDSFIEFLAPNTGDFFIGVSSYGNTNYDPARSNTGSGGETTGFYDLELALTPGPRLIVHDTLSTAIGLAFGQEKLIRSSGELYDPNQVQIYSIMVPAGETIGFKAHSTDGILDTFLRVFDSQGKTLVVNDESTGKDTQVYFTAPVTQLYYFGVSSSGNGQYGVFKTGSGNGGRTQGKFDLTIELIEKHDTLATALYPELDDAGYFQSTSTLVNGQQVILYSVLLEAGQILKTSAVTQGSTSSVFDTFTRVFDSQGNELASEDRTTGSEAFQNILIKAPTSGVYFIGVSSHGNYEYNPRISQSGVSGSYKGNFSFSIQVFNDPETLHDDISTAIPIDFDQNEVSLISGEIRFAQQTDLYSIRFQKGQVIQIDGERIGNNNRFNPILRIFDGKGNPLFINDDRSQGKTDSRLIFHVTESKNYFVGISSFGNSLYSAIQPFSGEGGKTYGAYQLSVKLLENDFGDGISDSQVLVLPPSKVLQVHSNISHRTDFDYYSLQVSKGDRISIDVTAYSFENQVDLKLEVLNGETHRLSLSDNNNGYDPNLVFDVEDTGWIFIKIAAGPMGFDPKQGVPLEAIKSYQLTLRQSPGTESGNNRTFSTADLIQPNSKTTGHWKSGEGRYFRFQVDEPGKISILLNQFSGNSIPIYVSLYDSKGLKITQTSNSQPLKQYLLNGEYYFLVEGISSQGGSSFLLETSYIPCGNPFEGLSLDFSIQGFNVNDINHDDIPDLVGFASTFDMDSVVVALGVGDGAFQKPCRFPLERSGRSIVPTNIFGSEYYSVEKVKLNEDDFPDFVITATNNFYLTRLYGKGDGTFESVQEFVGVAAYSSVASGDFDNDGIADLAFSLNGRAEILINLSQSGNRVILETELDPFLVKSGDVNGDGFLDILVGTIRTEFLNNESEVVIYYGDGHGNFIKNENSLSVGGAFSFAMGDFNTDGRLDLAVSNKSLSSINIYNNLNGGLFVNSSNIKAGEGGFGIQSGDFDSDGLTDLIIANSGENTVTVLLSKGDGAFNDPQYSTIGFGPNQIQLGDLDQNGLLDVAAGSPDGKTIYVALGIQGGKFLTSANLVGRNPVSIASGDFNFDGSPDIVSANFLDNNVSVSLGRGNGALEKAVFYPVGLRPVDVVCGDFNKDGTLDVATANQVSKSVSILLGLGDGTFLPFQTVSLSVTPQSIQYFAPFQKKSFSQPSLVVVNEDGTISFLVGIGEGHFRDPVKIKTSQGQFVCSDFNQDGYPDLATFDSEKSTIVLRTGFFDNFEISREIPSSNGLLYLEDIDLNGKDDIISLDDKSNFKIVKFDSSGMGSVEFRPAFNFSISSLVFGQLDNQSGLDTLALLSDLKTVTVFLDKENREFVQNNTFVFSDVVKNIIVKDFNSDGFLDFEVLLGSGSVSEFLGTGKGGFRSAGSSEIRFSVPNATNSSLKGIPFLSVDMNRDGTLDLVTASFRNNTLSVFLRQGDGVFRSIGDSAGAEVRNSPLLQDLNGDGLTDLISLNSLGQILIRNGTGEPGGFLPPFVLNPNQPVRAFTLVSTWVGFDIAGIDFIGDFVSVYKDQYIKRKLDSATSLKSGSVEGAVPGQSDLLQIKTGSHPLNLAATDLNGDGLDDLVVTNGFDNSISISFRNSSGGFETPFIRSVGANPSSIQFAKTNQSGKPDILIANQLSGDVSVLINDSSAIFSKENRFRMGDGLFGMNPTPNQGRQVTSQVDTSRVLSGVFSNESPQDLVVLNRGKKSLSLYRSKSGSTYDLNSNPFMEFPTSERPGDIQLIHFPGDLYPSLGVLMDNLNEIWIYRNQQDGKFNLPSGSNKIQVGVDSTGFTVQSINGSPKLLVGNQFGDVLTLSLDNTGHFIPERSAFNAAPLAIGETKTGQQFAVVADQVADKVSIYYRKKGTNQFDKNIPVNPNEMPLLAPGAVQLFQVGSDPTPYMVVANSLSNSINLFRGKNEGLEGFTPIAQYFVGSNPVGVTAGDINGDGIPDLVVANKGSNDVSVLLGSVDPVSDIWKATPYQRLPSGGSGPVSVSLRESTENRGPDLQITNSDGKIALLSGIGTDGAGTGFFQTNPQQVVSLPFPVRPLFPVGNIGIGGIATGENGQVVLVDGNTITTLFDRGVMALSVVNQFLIVGFADQSIQVVSFENENLGRLESGFVGDISALEALDNGFGLDIFATEKGSDKPIILTLPFSSGDIPKIDVRLVFDIQSTNLISASLVLVATLGTGRLVEVDQYGQVSLDEDNLGSESEYEETEKDSLDSYLEEVAGYEDEPLPIDEANSEVSAEDGKSEPKAFFLESSEALERMRNQVFPLIPEVPDVEIQQVVVPYKQISDSVNQETGFEMLLNDDLELDSTGAKGFEMDGLAGRGSVHVLLILFWVGFYSSPQPSRISFNKKTKYKISFKRI